jgi:hypothetical protein
MGKSYIEVDVVVGYDRSYEKKTEHGVILGAEFSETVRIPIEDATDIVQSQVLRLDYDAARELVKKYKNVEYQKPLDPALE